MTVGFNSTISINPTTATASKRNTTFLGLDEVIDDVQEKMPNRIILHGVQGWGKTTLASYIPDAIFLQSRRETGLQTLISSGAIQHKVKRFPRDAREWTEAIHAISELNVRAHKHRFLVLDTLNGFLEMLKEHIVITKFNNEIEKFESYGAGMKAVIPEWKRLLNLLDSVRDKGMGIMCLCHTKITTFKNPSGPDYDRWVPSIPEAIWDLTNQWADMVLFGSYETIVKMPTNNTKATKGKVLGGQTRLLTTEHSAVADAKNRHNLPPKILLGSNPKKAWARLAEAFAQAQQNNSIQNESEDSNEELDDTESEA